MPDDPHLRSPHPDRLATYVRNQEVTIVRIGTDLVGAEDSDRYVPTRRTKLVLVKHKHHLHGAPIGRATCKWRCVFTLKHQKILDGGRCRDGWPTQWSIWHSCNDIFTRTTPRMDGPFTSCTLCIFQKTSRRAGRRRWKQAASAPGGQCPPARRGLRRRQRAVTAALEMQMKIQNRAGRTYSCG